MSLPLKIVKMAGAGNDFVVLGSEEAAALGTHVAEWVRRVCRRGLSVGADGVLVVAPERSGVVRVTFYNPDGGEAFCGNGTRCAARFARRRGWVGDRFVLETRVGDVPAEVHAAAVRLVLPPPKDLGGRTIDLRPDRLEGRLVDAGVPHFVVEVPRVADVPLPSLGPRVRRHPELGAEGANADWMERDSEGGLRIRTWERGVEGETLSCGTGAVAAAFAARLAGGPPSLRVVPASGVPLTVSFPGDRQAPESAVLEGDARFVFEGTLDPEAVAGISEP